MAQDKKYIKALLQNLKAAFENDEKLTFKIVEPKEKGFLVKTGGLFAFVSYHHMPWQYVSLDYWHNVSNYLIGNCFSCNIYKLDENPINIYVDAKQQEFNKPELIQLKKYNAIVLSKKKTACSLILDSILIGSLALILVYCGNLH